MKIFALFLALFAGLAGCACSNKEKKDAHLPSKMLPNNGMSESRAKGLGPAAVFAK